MTPPTILARYAARQHHLITTAQLHALGCSKDAIRHLVRTERIFRVHRGVYAVGREQLTQRARWNAAVLASPPGSGLGLLSAAVFRELLRYDAPLPQVIVPLSRSRHRRPGIDVRRSSTLVAADIETVDAIRVTTVLRTLADLARSPLQDDALKAAVRQAGRLHKVDLQQLRGKPRLDGIVRLYDPLIALTESDFEALFLAMCTRYRLPLPDPQTRFGRRRADFAWPRYRLVVECQSRLWHDNDVNHQDDRAKHRELAARGYLVLPFTWAEVVHGPAAVAREIRAAVERQERLGVLGRT